MRRQHIELFTLTLLSFFLTGCSRHEWQISETSVPIAFSPFSTVSTKAEQVGAMTQSIGLFATHNIDGVRSVPFFDNLRLSSAQQNVDGWGQYTYSPLRYWPLTGTLDFYAYSPYYDEMDNYRLASSSTHFMETHTENSRIYSRYTVAQSNKPQEDFLWATNITNATPDNPSGDLSIPGSNYTKVPLSFRHKLAKLNFLDAVSFVNLSSAYTATVTHYALTSLYCAQEVWHDTGDWKDTPIANTTTNYTFVPNFDSEDYLLVLPQITPSNANLRITLSIVHQSSGEEIGPFFVNIPIGKETPNAQVWEEGKAYKIEILLEMGSQSNVVNCIQFEAQVIDWITTYKP